MRKEVGEVRERRKRREGFVREKKERKGEKFEEGEASIKSCQTEARLSNHSQRLVSKTKLRHYRLTGAVCASASWSLFCFARDAF